MLKLKLISGFIIATLTCASAFAQYIWVDEKGNKQFSDTLLRHRPQKTVSLNRQDSQQQNQQNPATPRAHQKTLQMRSKNQ
jgi:hypothetical protein